MKRLRLTLTLFALLANYSFAQTYFSFPDTNTTWNYLSCQAAPNSSDYYCDTKTYSISGDTIIKNKQYHNIYLDSYGHWAAIREDSLKRVYIVHFQDTVESLKFNFAGNVGDTMQTQPLKTILAKDSIVVAGIYRDRYILSGNDTIIEGIGGINEMIGTNAISPPFVWGYLLCMTQNDTLTYQSPKYQTCDTTYSSWTGINRLVKSVLVKIYPNPFNEFTTIEIEGFKNKWTWTLYNSIGQTVQHIDNISATLLTINRGELVTGIYLYQVTTENKLVTSGKLTIE